MPALDLIGNADAYRVILSRAYHRVEVMWSKARSFLSSGIRHKKGLPVPDQQPLIRAKNVSRRLGFVVALDLSHPDISEADRVSVVL